MVRRETPRLERYGVTVLAVDAPRGLAILAARMNTGAPAFDCIFLDPPYVAAEDYSRVLEFLGTRNFLLRRDRNRRVSPQLRFTGGTRRAAEVSRSQTGR